MKDCEIIISSYKPPANVSPISPSKSSEGEPKVVFFSPPPLHASYSEPVVLAIVGGSSEQETEPKV